MNYRPILTASMQAIILYLAGFLIPVLGQVIALFTPVPFILVYLRHGRAEGLSTLALSGAVITVLTGWQIAVIMLFSFGLMALGTAEAMRKRLKAEYVALAGGLLPIAIVGAVLAFYFFRVKTNPITVLETFLSKSMAESAKLYTSIGLAEMAALINSISAAFIHNLARLVPGILITMSVLQAVCCFGLVRMLLLRKQEAGIALDYPSLVEWHAPDSWVWGLIVCLALIAIPVEAFRLSGFNLAIMFSVVYTIQGIALVEHYMRKALIHPVLRSLLHSIILILPTIAFVVALGVVDIWADFRKVRQPGQNS